MVENAEIAMQLIFKTDLNSDKCGLRPKEGNSEQNFYFFYFGGNAKKFDQEQLRKKKSKK